MRGLIAIAGIACLMLAACGEADEPQSPPAPRTDLVPYTPPPVAATPATAALDPFILDMVDCAAAYAAHGKIDPASPRQDLDNPWFQEFAGLQMFMQTMGARSGGAPTAPALTERLAYWKGQPADGLKARAEACKAKY